MTQPTRKVLILGGTAWLGRAVAEQALHAGLAVTCSARGSSGTPVPGAEFVRMDRRQPDAYRALAASGWDEVIELGWDPVLVNGAVEHLAERAGHWTIVSSVSVYARTDEPGADEQAALLDPGDASDYGAAKVASEDVTYRALGGRALIVRPGLIAGPGDGSDRLGYWPARLAAADDGNVLVPALEDRWVQAIDVADLAAFLVHAGSQEQTGSVNAVGSVYAFEDFLTVAAEVAGFRGRFVHHADEQLLAQDVGYFAGPRSLPLWVPREDNGFLQRANGRYLRGGGTLRSMRETLQRTLLDERERGLDRERNAGLRRSDELDVLDRLGR